MKNKKAFTLIEVLAVIIILSILSAFIVPRLANQSNLKYTAEAHHLLGAIRRAQITYKSIHGSYAVAWCTPGTSCDSAGNNWRNLGFKDIAANGLFIYTCPDVGGSVSFCTTTPIGGKKSPSGYIQLDLDKPTWRCGGSFKKLADNKGCTI